MVELSHHLRFPQQAGAALGAQIGFVQHFDRHSAFEYSVVGAVYGAHPTPAQLDPKAIAAVQSIRF